MLNSEKSNNLVRCFLIDDDQDDREIFQMAVTGSRLPVQLDTASDGESGLEKLRSLKDLPDFVFLDLNMPFMDGKKCLVEIRKDKRLKDIPVIIYSTSSYINDIRETRRLGATGFITKPSNVNSLIEILSQVLANKYVFPSSEYYQ